MNPETAVLGVESACNGKQIYHTYGINDVVLGKGNGINSLPGNTKFRRIVDVFKPQYVAAYRREKGRVATQVIAAMAALDPPAKFLLRVSSSQFVEVSMKRQREKICQALREKKVYLPRLKKAVRPDSVLDNGGLTTDDPTTSAPAVLSSSDTDSPIELSMRIKCNSKVLGKKTVLKAAKQCTKNKIKPKSDPFAPGRRKHARLPLNGINALLSSSSENDRTEIKPKVALDLTKPDAIVNEDFGRTSCHDLPPLPHLNSGDQLRGCNDAASDTSNIEYGPTGPCYEGSDPFSSLGEDNEDANLNVGDDLCDSEVGSIRANDVLFGGRGRKHFNHKANQRYMDMIKRCSKAYIASPAKRTFAKSVYEEWEQQQGGSPTSSSSSLSRMTTRKKKYGGPGRFLQQDSKGTWHVMPKTLVLDKMCQTFRDHNNRNHSDGASPLLNRNILPSSLVSAVSPPALQRAATIVLKAAETISQRQQEPQQFPLSIAASGRHGDNESTHHHTHYDSNNATSDAVAVAAPITPIIEKATVANNRSVLAVAAQNHAQPSAPATAHHSTDMETAAILAMLGGSGQS